MRVLNIITLLLVIIGGINWGLVGLFDFDLVFAILGNGATETATSSAAARVVYILVAPSALYQIASLVRMTTTDKAVAYRQVLPGDSGCRAWRCTSPTLSRSATSRSPICFHLPSTATLPPGYMDGCDTA